MVSSTAANVSMPTAFSSEPPSNARRSGIAEMISISVCRAPSSLPHATTSLSILWSRFSSSAAGTRWNAVTTSERQSSACISLAIDPCGGSTALNSLPCFSRWLAIETTILPCELVGEVLGGRERRVGVHREHHDVGVARGLVVGGRDAPDAVAPLLAAARRAPPRPSPARATRPGRRSRRRSAAPPVPGPQAPSRPAPRSSPATTLCPTTKRPQLGTRTTRC